MKKMTLGVIVGNRDFFPDKLVSEGRADLLQLFRDMDIDPVILDEGDTKLGAVETYAHAKRCADLFRANADRIDGILVSLPNFGDERGVADTIKLSGLRVPILVQAYPDDMGQMSVDRRRDAFCGKISVCNNLKQYSFPFTLTDLHTVSPLSDGFRLDLDRFMAVCRVTNGLKSARLGAIGARPMAFNTVRYSEKLLQAAGISTVTVDLSEIFGAATRLADDDARVKEQLQGLGDYADASAVPPRSMVLLAKLAVSIRDWMKTNEVSATALQCWTSIQQNYGINPCAVMSMLSEELMPSACEVDVTGVVSMYALQLAAGRPGALVDWNNNYADDPDKCVLFHCGNWAKSFLPDAKIKYSDILGATQGIESTWGALAGRTPAGPFSFARVTTDDANGWVGSYVGEGAFTDDPLTTFGATAVIEVPGLQSLMRYVCKNGFEHHVAMTPALCADALDEAFTTYMGWDCYYHQG